MKSIYIYTVVIFINITTILFFNTQQANAQQDARYSMYMFNGLLHNPAYAGSAGKLSLNGFYRNQWTGFEGAPQTFSISGHAALGQAEKVGLGAWGEYDEIGVHKIFKVYGTYAYRFAAGTNGHLSAGIQGGITQMKSTFTDVSGPDEGIIDPTFAENQSALLPNFGVGLYYNTTHFYMGVSAPHLLNNKLDNGNDANVTKIASQFRQYNFTLGAVLGKNDGFKVKPSILIKAVPGNAPIQADANLSFLIKEVFWIGSSARFTDKFEPESVDAIIAFQLKNGLRIGYSYDYTLSDICKYNNGSHEVTIGYDLIKKDSERLVTPRYF